MDPRITYFPVGNGDCSLITLGDNTQIIIDCNTTEEASDESDPSRYDVHQHLLDFGKKLNGKIPHVDVFILTHADQDHCRGFNNMFYTGDPAKYTVTHSKEDLILIDELGRCGLRVGEAADERFPLVLVLPPRQREEARALFARALQHTEPGGTLLASMPNTEGAKSGEADLVKLAGAVQRVFDLLPGIAAEMADPAQRNIRERKIARCARREDFDAALERGKIVVEQAVNRLDRFRRETLYARGALGQKAAVDGDTRRRHQRRSLSSMSAATALAKCLGESWAATSLAATAPMLARRLASPASRRSQAAASSTLASAHI